MNIVCLSNLSDTPGFVVREVARRFPQASVLRVQSVPRKPALRRRLRNALLRGTWLRPIEQRWFYRSYYERGLRRLDQLLYGAEGAPPLSQLANIPSNEVNHLATARKLASLRPDILLVAGAPILKPHVYGIPRLAAINVHFGIAPLYRGEHTLFWPIYFRDEGNVGVTIHLIDKGIDTGRMLAQGFVSVTPGDDEWSIEAKAARLAAELVIEVLEDGRFEPCWQPSLETRGRVYNFSQRRIWHDAALAARRRWLGELPRPSASRRGKLLPALHP